MQEENIKTTEIKFIIYPLEFIFPRDFGAEILINTNGEKILADFDFNVYGIYPPKYPIPREYVDFARFHAEALNIKNSIFSRLISESGNREFNGMGVMMAIEDTEVNKRNSTWSKENVEAEFKCVFNLEKIIWLPLPTYGDENQYTGAIPDEEGAFKAYRSASANGHIDEMARFARSDTILIAHIDEEEAKRSKLHALDKERLDKAYTVLKNATDAKGKAFQIIKMPVPEAIYFTIKPNDDIYESFQSAGEMFGEKMLDGTPFPKGKMKVLPALSYLNFLITNNLVIAQKYYKEGMPIEVKNKDEEAMRILKKVFPERKVIAINTLAMNFYGGGIHCNTRNIPK